MADLAQFQDRADALKLRAKPRPVAQFNSKVVNAAAGVGAAPLFLTTSVKLDPRQA